jgi:hypothetical protein
MGTEQHQKNEIKTRTTDRLDGFQEFLNLLDAPDGISEEIKVTYAVAEYVYKNHLLCELAIFTKTNQKELENIFLLDWL